MKKNKPERRFATYKSYPLSNIEVDFRLPVGLRKVHVMRDFYPNRLKWPIFIRNWHGAMPSA